MPTARPRYGVHVVDRKHECCRVCAAGSTATAQVEGADREVELEHSEGGDWLISRGLGS